MIFSTPDNQHAMGVYPPELPQSGFPGIGYVRGAWGSVGQPGSTVKWNCAFRGWMSNGPDHDFRCYVMFGTRAEVQESMRLLVRSFTVAPMELPAAGPVPTPATVAQIVAYAGGWGTSGQWWCDAHFGGNLGGGWDCLGVTDNTCDAPVAGFGNRVTCQRFNTIATLSTYAQAPGLTGQWWCSAHYGGNLGGIWDCLSTNGVRQACDTDVPTGTQVRCGQR